MRLYSRKDHNDFLDQLKTKYVTPYPVKKKKLKSGKIKLIKFPKLRRNMECKIRVDKFVLGSALRNSPNKILYHKYYPNHRLVKKFFYDFHHATIQKRIANQRAQKLKRRQQQAAAAGKVLKNKKKRLPKTKTLLSMAEKKLLELETELIQTYAREKKMLNYPAWYLEAKKKKEKESAKKKKEQLKIKSEKKESEKKEPEKKETETKEPEKKEPEQKAKISKKDKKQKKQKKKGPRKVSPNDYKRRREARKIAIEKAIKAAKEKKIRARIKKQNAIRRKKEQARAKLILDKANKTQPAKKEKAELPKPEGKKA